VGLWWGAQIVFLALLPLWGLAGFRFLHGQAGAFRDRFGLAVSAVALGCATHLGLAFLWFHRPLVKALGLADLRAAALLAALALLPVAFAGARRLRADALPPRAFASPLGALALFAGASLVALLTAYGYRDGLGGPENQVSALAATGQPLWGRDMAPEWGSTQDRHHHLFEGGVAARGFPRSFPRGVFQHRGVETTLAAVAYLSGPLQVESWMAVSKPLSLLWLFLAAYGLYAIARERAGEAASVAAGLGALLFAAINPWLIGAAADSTYRMFPASGSLYHNVTQQASLGVGLVGLALCCRALADGARLFSVGSALMAASLFYKPSFFMIAGPFLAAAAVLQRRRLSPRDLAVGLAWLLGSVAAWLAYPRLFGLTMLGMPVEAGLFAWQRNTYLALPRYVTSTWMALVIVTVLSFAAFVLPLADALRRRTRPSSAATWTLLAIAVAGLACGVLLVEQGRKAGQGNVMWSAAAALLVALPLLVQGIERIASPPLRRAAWCVYALHLASGAWNLWLFAWLGLF
jgi:hypothetical protein